jgi:hypothetical protein
MTLPRVNGTGRIVKNHLIILTGTLANQMTKAIMKIAYIYSLLEMSTGMILCVVANNISFVKQGLYVI